MMNLSAELWNITAALATRLPPGLIASVQASIDDLAASKVPNRALKAGDSAPDFRLSDTSGRDIALSELLLRGPVVLTFYRGGWCPYCNAELRAYQAILSEIRALGGDLVAISPQEQGNSLLTVARDGLSFPVLSDAGGRVAERFGLTYAVPPALRKLAQRLGHRPSQIGGGDQWRLPIPATYLIARGRLITMSGLDADFRRRLEPTEVLLALRDLAYALGLRRARWPVVRRRRSSLAQGAV